MRDLTHHGEVDINYVLTRPNVPSDVLIVSFPGNGGREFAASQLGYTYMMTVGAFNVNALYLRSDSNADHGENAYSLSRMTCINRDFKIERTIVELINKTKEEVGATRVIAVGSSMGGYIATYYGLKYDWDTIAGAPPYAFDTAARVDYTAGGTTDDDFAFCNSLLPDIIKEAGERGFNKHLFLMWGKGENFYKAKEHAPQLLKDLKKAGIAYTLKLEEYGGHSAVHHLFPNILKHQLGVVLGLVSADEEPDIPPAEKVLQFVGTSFKSLQGQTEPLANTAPNYSIVNRTTWGDARADIKLRTFVYGAQGYHWLPKLKVPYQVPGGAPNVTTGSDFFWTSVPIQNGDYATAFWYQQTLLNHYKNTGNTAVFRLLDLNTRMFVFQRDAVARIAARDHNSWWTALRRLYYLLDFSCVAKENIYTSFDVAELKPAVRNAVNLMCAGEIKPADSVGMYRRLLGTLHAAQYYKNNAEFYEQAYNTVWSTGIELNDYYFDNNGVCIFEQVRIQHTLQPLLRQIADFAVANEFPETKDSRKFNYQLAKIEEATAHLVRDDGYYVNLGHNDYAKVEITPASGNFIKPESNIAILSDERNYITVHSGSNIHSAFRHCDLLSFTWHYDGKQLVYEVGGGNGGIAEYARSSVSHSALFADDMSYITPDYIDFTAITAAVERDEYVFLTLRHTLLPEITLTRRLLWVKPNVIVISDEAQSEAEHTYTQNFLFPNVAADETDKSNITLNIADNYTLKISQFGGETFELAKYNGTTNVNADEKDLRGSRVVGFAKLEKLLNLAYDKRGTSATFLTMLEAHSGGDGEVSVNAVSVDGDILRVELDNGTIIEETLIEPTFE